MRQYLVLFCLSLLLSSAPLFAQTCDPSADTDGDGTDDCSDGCPTDSYKTAPDVCGCGFLEIDFNTDGTQECVEPCEYDPAKTAGGICECPLRKVLEEILGIDFGPLCGNAPVLNRKTVIDDPPGVVVISDAAGDTSVKLFFQKFAGAFTTAQRAVFDAAAAVRKRLKVRYEAVITPEDLSKQILKRTSKKNELVVKNLAPGSYSVKYRAQGLDGDRVAFKTAFSPSNTFVVP